MDAAAKSSEVKSKVSQEQGNALKMVDINYVRNYFSEHALEWLVGAYGEEALHWKYPVGAHRVRVAIQSIARRIGSTGSLVDLGCGGGELCIHAARLGMSVTGVDIAEGMISDANKKRDALADELQTRLTFALGEVLENKLPAESYNAATALGLIEYLPQDGPFFREAYRLLKPGGVLAVSCRNRLFNMTGLNEYTTREIKDGSSNSLISEIESLTQQEISPEVMNEFVQRLESTVHNMNPALQLDLKNKAEKGVARKTVAKFDLQRRQHTPDELMASASAAGFVNSAFVGVHPHLLPPKLEASVPRLYNQLASVLEVFEDLPISLVWSSAFVGVFSKPEQSVDETN